jgi:mannose-6-phosphate isomerase-like protein (cupin superfamily)
MPPPCQTEPRLRVSYDAEMSDYEIQNIKELEDSAVKFGLSPQVEARFGRSALEAQKSGFSYQRFEAGYRQAFGHVHADQEETYVIVSGNGRVKIGDDVIDVKQWDAIRVAPKTPRAFEAGDEELVLIAFGAGESGDADMLQDFWPAEDPG